MLMSTLAGVIYSDILQTSNFVEPMLEIMKRSSIENKVSYNYKNFQMGCTNGQIISNSQKTIFLIFDGQIDLPSLIKNCSLTLEKNFSDEGYLIKAYEKQGIDFIKNLSGEFAFVLLDQEKNCLFLAKDRIGKKPLYWHFGKQHFLFASELKALLATGLVPQTAAPDAIAAYLFFGFIPQDMTPVKDVNKLLPAHFLRYSPSQGISIIPYWSLSSFFEKPLEPNQTPLFAKIEESLRKAVQKRIPDKESFGCFVSGGIGSATVAYYIRTLAQETPIKSFTVGFKGQNDQDVAAALEVSKVLSLDSELEEIDKEQFTKNLVKIAWHLDEPLADPNLPATWQYCSLAGRFTSTVFSGMGCDELLASHSRYTFAERDFGKSHHFQELFRPLVLRTLIPLCNLFYKPYALQLLKTAYTNPSHFEFLRGNAILNEVKLKEASPSLATFFDPDTFLHKFYNISKIRSTTSALLYFDVKNRLPDNYILQYERLTRAHFLNWETPFLDQNLVELAARLPEPEFFEEDQTASYLKPLIKEIFSQKFINRPKKTRKNFLSPWILQSDLYSTLKLLIHGTVVDTGFISKKWLEKQLANEGSAMNSFQALFAILMLEIWFRLFINKPMSNYPPGQSVRELLLEG